jgi:aminoglycoside phosphotransferase (APT) family kinase protein
VPALFDKRPVVLAHGDFAPVNMLTDGTSLSGLLDFESVRLARPALRCGLVGMGGQLPTTGGP